MANPATPLASLAPLKLKSTLLSFDQVATAWLVELSVRPAGGVVSTIHGPPWAAAPVLPARSTAQTWRYQMPSASAPLVAARPAVELPRQLPVGLPSKA